MSLSWTNGPNMCSHGPTSINKNMYIALLLRIHGICQHTEYLTASQLNHTFCMQLSRNQLLYHRGMESIFSSSFFFPSSPPPIMLSCHWPHSSRQYNGAVYTICGRCNHENWQRIFIIKRIYDFLVLFRHHYFSKMNHLNKISYLVSKRFWMDQKWGYTPAWFRNSCGCDFG